MTAPDEANVCRDCGCTFSSPDAVVGHQAGGTCRYTLRIARSHTALLAAATSPREAEK